VSQLRSELYFSLAEVLTSEELPDWFKLPGKEWPLFECVSRMSGSSASAQRAVPKLAHIPAETKIERQERSARLFCGTGRPQFWLYESLHRSGRLLGPECTAVANWYQKAGLEAEGSELPDHASLELAFLGHLAGRNPPAGSMERAFILQHAGCWLPDLGKGMASTGDSVYGPLGDLLAGWLEEALQPDKKASLSAYPSSSLPLIQVEERCSLCGFCAQVCPVGALSIKQTQVEAFLLLSPGSCTGCKKCERVCDFNAIQLVSREATLCIPRNDSRKMGDQIVLRRSYQSFCWTCGKAIATQAEMDFLHRQLGFPKWLENCPDCRSACMEVAQ
jgi:ferredoxin